MSASTLPNATLTAAYEAMTPGSAKLAAKARDLLPSGIAHDGRNMDPYPLYVERALGPVKWDVDNNKYVDYFGGHGALILGHNHPTVMAAVHAALDRGTHFGACHELEVRWAELITQMVPSAERVRFTSSGTEATLMALRLARACTGREKVVRFRGHFHGWNDHMTSGYSNHFDGTPTSGVVHGLSDSVLLCDPNDVEGVTRIFNDHKDIAAVILEPTGASFGKMPILPSFLQVLRDLTSQSGTILIFDEVVTGFRVSPGGMQQAVGITPDMTTLAKIVSGGLPGGAVAGPEGSAGLARFQSHGGEQAGEDLPPRHIQCEPGLCRRRHRDAGDFAVHRCVRPSQRLRRRDTAEDERGAGRRRREMGCLRHVFRDAHLHQSGRRRHHAVNLRRDRTSFRP